MDRCKYLPTETELDHIMWLRRSIDYAESELQYRRQELTDYCRQCDANKDGQPTLHAQ